MTNCIYRIECLNPEIKDFYIGSTVDLKERIGTHKFDCKNSNLKIYTFIRENGGWDNWKFDIELLTTGYDKEIRREMEQNYIDCLKPSLNSRNAKGHDKLGTRKKYRMNNNEKIKEKANVKVSCNHCNKLITRSNLARHINDNCKGKETPSLINLGDICPPKMVN